MTRRQVPSPENPLPPAPRFGAPARPPAASRAVLAFLLEPAAERTSSSRPRHVARIARNEVVFRSSIDAPGPLGLNGPSQRWLGEGRVKVQIARLNIARLTRRLLMLLAASALLLGIPAAATAFASSATTGTGGSGWPTSHRIRRRGRLPVLLR